MTAAERQRRHRAGLSIPRAPRRDVMRKAKLEAKYGVVCAAVIMKSIGKVAAAGRAGDAGLIAAERRRHRLLMENLPL